MKICPKCDHVGAQWVGDCPTDDELGLYKCKNCGYTGCYCDFEDCSAPPDYYPDDEGIDPDDEGFWDEDDDYELED